MLAAQEIGGGVESERQGGEAIDTVDQSRLWRQLSVTLPFLQSWKLIWRSLLTVGMLAVVRILYFMPIRGVQLKDLPDNLMLTSPEQALLADMFLAGDSVPLNIALLGITPIVVSSLFCSIMLSTPLGDVLPIFRKMRAQQKTGVLGPEGVERTVFALALMIGAWQALRAALLLRPYALTQPNFVWRTVADLLAALAVTRHCCSVIEDQGLGEGTGFLILGLTLSGFASRLSTLGVRVLAEGVVVWQLCISGLSYLGIVTACVWLNQAELRLPLVDYSMRRMRAALLSHDYRSPGNQLQESGASGTDRRNYLPLPLSQGGVTVRRTPNAEFSTYVYLLGENMDRHNRDIRCLMCDVTNRCLLKVHVGKLDGTESLFVFSAVFSKVDSFLLKAPAWASFLHSWVFRIGVFGLGVFLITLVPLGTSPPERVSEFLARLETGVKGVIPGQPTVRHLQRRMFQARFWGGLIFAGIAMLSLWLDWQSFTWFGTSLGTLNLILLVAVIGSAARQVEALLEGPKLQRIMEREQNIMRMLSFST